MISIQVKLPANIQTWSNNLYGSDVNRLFNSLNDAHTMYYPPYPYSICYGFKPFMLTATVENGTTVVRLAQNSKIRQKIK